MRNSKRLKLLIELKPRFEKAMYHKATQSEFLNRINEEERVKILSKFHSHRLSAIMSFRFYYLKQYKHITRDYLFPFDNHWCNLEYGHGTFQLVQKHYLQSRTGVHAHLKLFVKTILYETICSFSEKWKQYNREPRNSLTQRETMLQLLAKFNEKAKWLHQYALDYQPRPSYFYERGNNPLPKAVPLLQTHEIILRLWKVIPNLQDYVPLFQLLHLFAEKNYQIAAKFFNHLRKIDLKLSHHMEYERFCNLVSFLRQMIDPSKELQYFTWTMIETLQHMTQHSCVPTESQSHLSSMLKQFKSEYNSFLKIIQ